MTQPAVTATIETKMTKAIRIHTPSSRSRSKPHEEPDREPEPELEPRALDAAMFDCEATEPGSASVKLPEAPPPPKLPPPEEKRGTSTPDPDPEPKSKPPMLLEEDPRSLGVRTVGNITRRMYMSQIPTSATKTRYAEMTATPYRVCIEPRPSRSSSLLVTMPDRMTATSISVM